MFLCVVGVSDVSGLGAPSSPFVLVDAPKIEAFPDGAFLGNFRGAISAYWCLLVPIRAFLESLFFAINCYSSLLTADLRYQLLLMAIKRY